jgi:hypothetical protein
MSGDNPSLKDIWRLLGTMNKRFDAVERQIVQVREDLGKELSSLRADMGAFRADMSALRADMSTGFGALKGSIEARDFRLDDHGRRLTELESSRP